MKSRFLVTEPPSQVEHLRSFLRKQDIATGPLYLRCADLNRPGSTPTTTTTKDTYGLLSKNCKTCNGVVAKHALQILQIVRYKYRKRCDKNTANSAIKYLQKKLWTHKLRIPDASTYRPRLADIELKDKLTSASTVLIEGPRGCGKTATASQFANSEVFFDTDINARRACSIDPNMVLEGETPRLFDEWQLVPNLWNHVRRASDARIQKGNFILTGSAVPTDDLTRHSGAGRISRLQMRTMSMLELGLSSAKVSLSDLLANKRISAPRPSAKLQDLVEYMCRGGWPGTLDDNLNAAMRFVTDYIAEICRTDVENMVGVRHDPDQFMRVLQALARNISTEVSLATLAKDLELSNNGLQPRTVANYLTSLARLFVIEDLPPFSPHLRSRARLRKAPKRHFTDPSIAVAVLQSNPDQLFKDLGYLGFLFESFVVHELRVYAALLGAYLSHYRDSTGLEIDIVIQTASGSWIPCEVKLGNEESVIDAAAASLLKFVDKIDQNRMGKPSNLLIVTSSGYAYQRRDGVTVVPITSLGP